MAEPVAAPGVIEAEADDYVDDSDSAFGGATIASSTTSVTSTIMRYRVENGRTYHAYKDGQYLYPNDEMERDRLDLQHHLCLLTFSGALFTCPLTLPDGSKKPIHNVLDIGTGTGIWAIDFADEHPEANVLGIDLSPIQPSFVPPNLSFQVDDLDGQWTFGHKFDFIYSRMMTASFEDWPRFFAQSFEYVFTYLKWQEGDKR
jgi:SAM-dependent methyltransferase